MRILPILSSSFLKKANILMFDVMDFPFLGLDKAEKSPYTGWSVSGPSFSPENEYVFVLLSAISH